MKVLHLVIRKWHILHKMIKPGSISAKIMLIYLNTNKITINVAVKDLFNISLL